GDVCSHVCWKPPKKNSLFLINGPPTVPPAWLRFRLSDWCEKKLFALKSELRINQNPFACSVLAPLLVTTLTEPAELFPVSAAALLVWTENPSTASGKGNGMFSFCRLSLLPPLPKVKRPVFARPPLTASPTEPAESFDPPLDTPVDTTPGLSA